MDYTNIALSLLTAGVVGFFFVRSLKRQKSGSHCAGTGGCCSGCGAEPPVAEKTQAPEGEGRCPSCK
ncbi:MAG: hypothetical protein P8Y66_04200 [Nitrospirota bacterium]|jgi:hypothetical protein